MIEFLLKILRLAKPYKGRLLLGALAGVLGGLVEPLMIATIAFVYGAIFPDAAGESLIDQMKSTPTFLRQWAGSIEEGIAKGVAAHPWAMAGLVGAIPVVFFLRGLLGYLNVYFLQWAAVRTVTDLRVRLFEHITRLSAGFFSQTSTGKLMSRITSDTSSLQHVLSGSVGVIVKDPVTVIALVAYLLWQQPGLTIIAMIAMPACMVPVAIYSRKIRQSSRAMQTNAAELSNVMSEALTGNRVVKAYNLESTVVGQFRETANRYISHYMRIVRSSEIPGPLLETVGAFGVSLVLVYLAAGSTTRPSSKDFLILVGSLFAVYRPMKNITRLHISINQARAASERVFELLALENAIVEPARPVKLDANHAPIRFESVHFSYGDKKILSDINLVVEPGKVVALVGKSGSGKTTILNLLLRFYDAQSGAIRIGNTSIRDVTTKDLRGQIAIVTQETVLFNQTLYRNIEMGRPSATREEVIEAARLAHALDFINEKPEGFDTVVGEKGVTLSGGQRQRIAIARAILKNAPILLLDEATNALDTESERAVQAALEKLMEGRTAICIAHRLSTIQNADRIVVMEAGRIREQGSHAELLRAGGLYRKLHELQFDSAELMD
jgi:subfamily B ATP-binding cassette protein MsbA